MRACMHACVDTGERLSILLRCAHAPPLRAKSDTVVETIKRLSPGQRAGFIVMNETAQAISEGMHLPLRMQVWLRG
jgi:hypothetical protein